MSPSGNLPQRRIAGYRFVTRVATGGSSIIWKAEKRGQKKAMAVKLLLPNLMGNREAHRNFEREYKTCRDFKHAGILNYIDYGELGKIPYMMMEYFASRTLKSCIVGDPPYPLFRNTRTIITDVGEALAYIHRQGVVHRDVKPDNILVSEEGEIRLIDFSISAKVSGLQKWLSFGRKISGTPSYMAPEQIRNEAATPATDIYAFGATIFEMLCGRPPFIGDSTNAVLDQHLKTAPKPVSRYNREVTTALDRLVLAMLAKNPADRPGDIKTFLYRFNKAGIFRTRLPGLK